MRAVEIRIVRSVGFEDGVDSGEQHPANSNNRFLVSTTLFEQKIAVLNFRVLCGLANGESALHKQRGLRKAPAREIRVVFFLPALSLFCGTSPAQEQRCFAVGNTDISTPISEIMVTADETDRGVTTYIVRTQDGIECTAIRNIFTNAFYADDVHGVIRVDAPREVEVSVM